MSIRCLRSTASGAMSIPKPPRSGWRKLSAPRSQLIISSSASVPPRYQLECVDDSAMTMAFRYDGAVDASAHCVKPM